MKMNKKQGVSLMVLVITLTSTYDEANKIDKIPPKNKIKSLKKIDKVVDFNAATFFVI